MGMLSDKDRYEMLTRRYGVTVLTPEELEWVRGYAEKTVLLLANDPIMMAAMRALVNDTNDGE